MTNEEAAAPVTVITEDTAKQIAMAHDELRELRVAFAEALETRDQYLQAHLQALTRQAIRETRQG